jgi:hypothetical protein
MSYNYSIENRLLIFLRDHKKKLRFIWMQTNKYHQVNLLIKAFMCFNKEE